MKRIFTAVFFCAFVMATSVSSAAEHVPTPPTAADKCPVCGMFVAKYPDWTSIITFRDSSRLYFDGPKDLFTYFFQIKKYTPGKSQTDIVRIQVKDYYSLAFIDGRKAYYATGGDVYGPMGNELIPFDKRDDAEEFLRDHKGKMLVKFEEITPATVKALE